MAETNQSKLKSSPRESLLWSQISNQAKRGGTSLKRSQISLEKWFIKIMCF